MESQDNYIKQLEKWRQEFSEKGREIVSVHNRYLTTKERYITVSYFQREYILDLNTGSILNADFTETDLEVMGQMMIYSHLVCLKRDAFPSGTMVSLLSIREAAVFDAAFRRRTGKELVDSLRDRLPEYKELIRAYGGIIENSGDFSVSFYAVLDLKITYVFWIGDEEFDSNIRVLFDSNITKYVHPESVVILGGHGFDLLEKIALSLT